MEQTKQAMPLCPYFGECGGCVTQHIHYDIQVQNKKNFLITELRRNNVSFPEDILIFKSQPYFYRNRMDFVFCNEGIGLRKRNTYNKIASIKKCVISNDKINQLLEEVWQWYDEHSSNIDIFDRNKRNKKTGTMRYAVLRASEHSDSSSVSFIVNSDSLKIPEQIELIKSFAEKTTAKNVVVGRIPSNADVSTSTDFFIVKGSSEMEEKIGDKTILFSSQSFFQNNTTMANEMVQYCYNVFKQYNTKNSIFIDLYGGAGSFGIALSELFKKTFIIDSEGLNIHCAKENIAKNNMKNIEARAMDASGLSKLILHEDLFLLADPPRIGMDSKVIKHIIELSPVHFIYVSCNPQQLAKELKTFQKYYSLVSLALFDLFPQTNHSEVVAELRRKK